MERFFKILAVLLFVFNFTFTANAQKLETSQDSIKIFYDTLFSKLREGYIYKDMVDLKVAEAKTTSGLLDYTDFETSLNAIEPLFSRIGATHCAIFYKKERYAIPTDLSFLEGYND